MSSLFYANPCKLDPDTIVTQLVWSNIDPIAAIACNTVDERDRETHQILFMNNEVRFRSEISMRLVLSLGDLMYANDKYSMNHSHLDKNLKS